MGQRVDSANIGVEAVGEAKIDDPINGTERNRGLRPISSERIEPLTPAACKDDGQDFHGNPSIKLGCDRFRGRSIPSSRCTTQILLYMEECLTRMITVMEIIELNSIFEVHRSRLSTAILFRQQETPRYLPGGGMRHRVPACPGLSRGMSPHMSVAQGTTPACGRQGRGGSRPCNRLYISRKPAFWAESFTKKRIRRSTVPGE